MHRFLLFVCLLTFVVLCVVAATGQVRHVTTVNPLSRSQQGYVEVYEFDYVDVKYKRVETSDLTITVTKGKNETTLEVGPAVQVENVLTVRK